MQNTKNTAFQVQFLEARRAWTQIWETRAQPGADSHSPSPTRARKFWARSSSTRKVGINHEIYNEPVDVTENTDVEIQDRHLGSDS